MKTWDEIGVGLRAKFAPEDLEWRVQQAGQTDTQNVWAMVVPFISNRGVMNLLDEVAGPGNWRNELREVKDDDKLIGFLCGLSIRLCSEVVGSMDDDLTWVTKWDGAPCTHIEALKGGISDSMKRAAVQWGIGRYLYDMPTHWAITTPQKQQGAEWKYQKASGRVGAYYWKPKPLPAEFLPEGAKMKGSKIEANQPDPFTDTSDLDEAPVEVLLKVDGLPADIHADLDQQLTVEDLQAKFLEYKPAGQQEGWYDAMYKFYGRRVKQFEDLEKGESNE